jgi:formylglycine-generating enzyme required for sulfatase activity
VGIAAGTGLPDILWCAIPAGSFTMGSSAEDEGSFDDERPQHQCEIPYEYRIARYPITVAQYQAFVDAGGYAEQRWWTESGWRWRQDSDRAGPEGFGTPFSLPNHPVVGVSWYEAHAFAGWLTAQMREHDLIAADEVVDLPSEAEWERAARGSGVQRYPWGDAFDPDRANAWETGIGSTSAVGCFPRGASPDGVEECSGNVWEWTRSTHKKYPYDAADGREGPEGDDRRVLRGGSWDYLIPRFFRVAFRYWLEPTHWNYFIGFRCVVRLPGR